MLGTKAIISPDQRHLTVELDGKHWVTIPLGFDLEPWARIYLKEQEAAEVYEIELDSWVRMQLDRYAAEAEKGATA